MEKQTSEEDIFFPPSTRIWEGEECFSFDPLKEDKEVIVIIYFWRPEIPCIIGSKEDYIFQSKSLAFKITGPF